MVCRLSPMFEYAPTALGLVTFVGGTTAIFAATVALCQNDIKRVIAYSTISQLGYMFLGVGLGAYSASMFHLTTHAFFKALLFLTAGVVVHTFAHNSADVDMRRLGGLNQGPLRWVGWAFVIGALALAGIPPFAGFWSKDEILTAALGEGQVILWILGLLTAFLTALYIFRAYFMTFTGAPREDVQGAHPHPVASSMSIPIVILAILSVIGGLLAFGMGAWLEPVFGDRLREFAFDPITSIAAVVLGLLGIGAAYALRGNYTFGQVGLFRNAFYFDQIYDAIFVRPVRALGSGLTTLVDDWTLNGLASGIYNLVTWLGNGLRLGQTGYTRNYGLAMLIGIFLIAGYFLIVTLGR
jgi:NADH-quinone oxidoreductase subunit L